MAIVKPQGTIAQLLSEGRRALGMSQREFGPALGASHRTATRWDEGTSIPYENNLRTLAELLLPVDRALATEAAAHIGETLESLGLAPPTPTPTVDATSAPARSAKDLVDIVVCAAAETSDSSPRAMRTVLYEAFRRAHQVGLTIEQVEQALAPEKEAPKAKAARGSRG
jgi:transcriptional regulator with XRE-family HTH domain